MDRSGSFVFQSLMIMILGSFASTAWAGKDLVYCSEGSPSIFNPQLATDGTTFNATRGIYNRLVEFKTGETTIIPGLAESWEVSKDGLTYTFKLRKGVKFHKTAAFTPSREFNADDVLFSFNRQRQKDHPYHLVNGGSYEYFRSMEMGSIIKDLQKMDDHTVKFVLSKPEAPFLANLAMDFASILSKEYADKLMSEKKADTLDLQPVGTGPFIFVKYVKDQVIRYKANEQYFRGKPALDNLVFTITQDPNVRMQKLKAGECQFATEPPPQDIPGLKQNPGLAVMEQAGLNVGYIAMNVEKKPFDNKLVRQAINHALNRQAYIEAIYFGNATTAVNPLPPTIWGYNKGVKDMDYNPEKAKELLKKAGFPNGFETELWTLPVSRPYNPNGKKMGEMMQADLAKVGIKVKLVTYDWPTYLAKSKKGEHAMMQMGWTGDNGDPDNFLNVLLGCPAVSAGSNYARWCHKSYAALMDKARTVTDIKERAKLYEKAQTIFKEEAPWVTIAHSKVFRVMSKKVDGYKIDPFGGDHFETVTVK